MEPTEPINRNKNLNSRKREEPYDRADKQEVTLMHAMRKSCQKQLDNYQQKIWKLCGVSSNRIEVWDLDSPYLSPMNFDQK